jgi:flap endonuclease-1
VRKGAEKLTKYLNTKQQGRLDGFFTVKPKPDSPTMGKKGDKGKGKETKGTKRKVRVYDNILRLVLMILLKNDEKAGASKKTKTKK